MRIDPIAHADSRPARRGNIRNVHDVVRDVTEPALRDLGKDGCKFVWWFVGKVKGDAREEIQRSQFFDVDEATGRVTYDRNRHGY